MIGRMADLADIAALAWPRRTARLVLRPATRDDLPAVWEIRRQESVGRWLPRASPHLEEFVELMSDPDRLGKTLVIEHDGAIVGDLMLAPEDGWAQAEVIEQAKGVQAELGWCLDPAFGGRGLATEAVGELVRIAFEELGLRRLVAHCYAANEPSWRLMERLGMRREAHVVKESLHRSGAWMDGVSYGLLAEEWSGAASTTASRGRGSGLPT
jgi:RimJ/RimL family protein N-acetyltransferase